MELISLGEWREVCRVHCTVGVNIWSESLTAGVYAKKNTFLRSVLR